LCALLLIVPIICTFNPFCAEAVEFPNPKEPFAVSPGRSPLRATAFPLMASDNNRYLVDQNNNPFLLVGDAPQTLIVKLSEKEAAAYMANRLSYGINTLWINLLCNFSDGCNRDATTFDGIAPFVVPGDLSTPNPAYFQRAADMVRLAAENGMLVLLDPIETSSWLDILRTNGTAKAFAYGEYLAERFKMLPNIIWMHGNDFQSWQNANDDALVQAVARGIKAADRSHIHTVELNYFSSASLDDPSWAPLIELDAAYSYFPTYAQVLSEYNRPYHRPVFVVEANYEFEKNPDTDGGSTQNLRRQEYWTMLSGATGHVYGSGYTWRLDKGWQTRLDSPGVIQLRYMRDLLAEREWYDLVPDQAHKVVTGGYHGLSCLVGRLLGKNDGLISSLLRRIRKHSNVGSIPTNTCVTAARNPDGSLVIAYLPFSGPITIDMSLLAAPSMTWWYDPTNGKYTPANDSRLANSGKMGFTPPAKNAAGDTDWMLVIETLTSP
jgi:hypothetical protein